MKFLSSKEDEIEVMLRALRFTSWWDELKEAGDGAHKYPRIWAYLLLFSLAVRMNFVLWEGSSPPLYRLTLLSYLLPILSMALEANYYETIEPSTPLSDQDDVPNVCVRAHTSGSR